MSKKSKPDFEASVYQDEHGNFFLRRSDRVDDEPLSEFEVRRFIQAAVERMQIQDAVDQLSASIGVKLPDRVREQIIRKTHKAAREQGITRTGSLPSFDKLLPCHCLCFRKATIRKPRPPSAKWHA